MGAKDLPSGIYNFLVADNVRQESTGKVTIIGAFSAGQIILTGKPVFPVSLPLAFFVVFKDGEGIFDAKIRITDPNQKTIGDAISLGLLTKNPQQAMQLLINFPMIPLIGEGEYKVEIMLDDRVYTEEFVVRKGSLPSPQLSSP